MTPERWETIKKIFDQAVDLPLHEQESFVFEAAPDDQSVQAEVLRLLRAHASTNEFLETPVANLSSFMQRGEDEPYLEVGSIIANRFEILKFLSRGGMGDVYSAWDAELIETVALKTIRPKIANNLDAIERFKREVKHSREVSHPNICRVHELFNHEIGPGQRVWFLSMELLPGQTLLERVRTGGPLPAALARNVTDQMVDGLSAAHSRGLVHRDFKSSNVILLENALGGTRAVITDFGLSLRLLGQADGLAEPGGMGTPGYMAPEQELNGEVGPLADQYALGAVMCEMLTGSLPGRPYGAPTVERKPVSLPERKFGPRWETVIRRCLAREPKERFARIEDVSRALAPPGVLGTPRRVAAALLLLLLLTLGALYWFHEANRCRVCDVVQLTPDTDESESPSLANSGREIVYSSDRSETGNLDIFLQQLPAGRPVRLTTNTTRDDDPSISPDGKTVAFRSERNGGGIYLIDSHGGPDRLLIAQGRNPKISPDGKQVVYWVGDPDPMIASGAIFFMPLAGGTPTQLAKNFIDARSPVWAPDGRSVLFSGCETAASMLTNCAEWWVASLNDGTVLNTHLSEQLQRQGVGISGVGFWDETGLVFGATTGGTRVTLWTVKLDPLTGMIAGTPRELLREEARDYSPTLARNRSIAFVKISGALHVWRIEHASHPDQKIVSKVTEDAEIDQSPFVSGGGRWLVFSRGRASRRRVWIHDNSADTETPLAGNSPPMFSPIVNNSGDVFVYEQSDKEGAAIYVQQRGTAARRLCLDCGRPTGWFNGERAVLYQAELPSEIRMIDPRSGVSRTVLREEGTSLTEASWSPTNEFMLFAETRGGQKRIYAVHVSRSSGKPEGAWIQIPDAGPSPNHPRWSGDGRTIFYLSNKDGFICIYGQAFSPEQGKTVGAPFAVAHYHNQRASIENVFPRSLNLSVDGDTIYFNLGEQSSTIWTGAYANR